MPHFLKILYNIVKKIIQKSRLEYTTATLEQNTILEIIVTLFATLITYKKQTQKIIVFSTFSLDKQPPTII